MNRHPLVIAAALACALAGCSSSAAHTASPTQSPATHGSSQASASSTQKAVGAAGPIDVATLCAAVKTADVQKMLKQPAGPLVVNAKFNECTWQDGNISITVHPHDDDLSVYNTINTFQHHFTLTGVGDKAEWAYDPEVSLGSVPAVSAHQGSITLSVNVGPLDQTTLRYTGTQDTKIIITPSSAAQYAIEEGQLCIDMFHRATG